MSFKDCYKNVFNTFTDFTNWSSIDAKIIDLCTDSNDEDITLYSWTPVIAKTESYWVGSGTKTSCWPGLLTNYFGIGAPIIEQFLDKAFNVNS